MKKGSKEALRKDTSEWEVDRVHRIMRYHGVPESEEGYGNVRHLIGNKTNVRIKRVIFSAQGIDHDSQI